MEKVKNKKVTEFRIPKLPKKLRKEIVYHQTHRMKGRPEIWKAAIEIIQAGIEVFEEKDKTNVSVG